MLHEQRCSQVLAEWGLAWLKQIPLKDTDRRLMDEDLILLKELKRHLEASEALVERLAEGDERVRLLKTIPGLGNSFRCSRSMKWMTSAALPMKRSSAVIWGWSPRRIRLEGAPFMAD
jgi:hypothetical protein